MVPPKISPYLCPGVVVYDAVCPPNQPLSVMKYLSSLLLTGALLGFGASTSQVFAQDVYNNGATITLFGGASIYVPGNLTNTSGGSISSSGSTVRVDGNMLNNAASTYDLGTAGALEVRGNLVNTAATFAPGTGTVTMAGTTGAQNLDMNGGQIYALTVNNTSGANKRVDVPSNVTVTNGVTLTSGMMKTAAASAVILPDGSSVSGETTGRYIAGNLQVTRNGVSGASPIVFPNGVSITPNAALGNLTITRTAGLQTAQTSYGTNPNNAAQKGIDRIWNFSTNPGTPASLTFTWLTDDDNGAASFASSRVWARSSAPVAGSQWMAVGNYQNAASRSITVPGDAFSFWTVSSNAAPLPVELLTFTAVRQGDVARLDWRTASEQKNDHWDIQVSTNGRDFRKFAEVAGHGSITSPSVYTLADPALLSYRADPVYYRLRQVDTDGQEAFSSVQAVRVAAKGFNATAYPNPVTEEGTTVEITTGDTGPAELAIYDATGRLLTGVKTELLAGRNTVQLPQAGKLATGAYFLKVNQGKQHTMLKLIRQ